jgi:hypothetical protein
VALAVGAEPELGIFVAALALVALGQALARARRRLALS